MWSISLMEDARQNNTYKLSFYQVRCHHVTTSVVLSELFRHVLRSSWVSMAWVISCSQYPALRTRICAVIYSSYINFWTVSNSFKCVIWCSMLRMYAKVWIHFILNRNGILIKCVRKDRYFFFYQSVIGMRLSLLGQKTDRGCFRRGCWIEYSDRELCIIWSFIFCTFHQLLLRW